MYDVVIIGSGPAGLTSAIYTTRANLKTLVIAGTTWGGQLMLTTMVENFPGFPEGIEGSELMMRMRKQAEKFGAEIIEENFVSGDFSKFPFLVKTDSRSVESKSVIIATGADTKWLGVSGEKERIGRGVSSCAPCDGPFFRNKNIIVAGGGDSAMEEAIVLTKYANSVTVVHRRGEFRASSIMVDKAKANEKIKFVLNSQITEIFGANRVEGVKLKDTNTGEVREMPIDGIFVAIGHLPNSRVFKGIEIDKAGYIKVREKHHTNIDGVFVAGDVHDSRYSQAITAAGYGCAVALETQWWLDSGRGA
jgi:thioredoxin reductase (NADPH)